MINVGTVDNPCHKAQLYPMLVTTYECSPVDGTIFSETSETIVPQFIIRQATIKALLSHMSDSIKCRGIIKLCLN